MRFIKIETDPINLVNLIEKILYKDCIRIINEYSMKLLLTNELNYSRSTDEITKQDLLLLEGLNSEVLLSENHL